MSQKMFKSCLLVIFIMASNFAVAATKVNYSLTIIDAAHHLAEVTVLFPKTKSSSIDFIMPAWRLGKYNILDLANGIRHLTVTDAKGHRLKVEKVDKNTWRVELDRPSKLAVSYQLYANQLETRTRHIDDSHAYLDGASTFIYSPEFLETAVSVSLDVPKGWRSRSGMTRRGSHRFMADNYHVLASSPIETGIHEYYSFSADDKQYGLAIWGKGNFDGKKIVRDYKKMVIEHGKMWGGYPFDRYLFIVHATSGATGATEHINSTVIQRDAMGFSPGKDYQKFLSTSSHEFVHTWNVKAYRPVGIQQYDYTRENYSDLLWIAEGSTVYLGELLLVRAGLLSAEEFLDALALKVQTYLNRPGRRVMTAQQASFDAWIEGGGDRANNASVNIYSKGNLLSLLMDVELLEATSAAYGYPEVHKRLYERFPVAEKGFSAEDIQNLMQEISGKDFSQLWQQHMESVGEIDFDKIFLSLGLKLSFLEPGSNGSTIKMEVWSGMEFLENSATNVISFIPDGSPAWMAGLTAGDILLAINGMKVEQNKLDLVLKSFQSGDEVKVTFFRRNLLHEKAMILSSRPENDLQLLYLDDATDLQKKMYEKWLGVDWPVTNH